MKPQSLSVIAAFVIMGAGVIFMSMPPARVLATTVSVVGWLAPDAVHWNNGIPVLVLSLAGVALFSMMGRFFDLKNIGAFALVGLVVGSLLGILSLGNSTSGNFVPFGLIIIALVDLVLYLWKGES